MKTAKSVIRVAFYDLINLFTKVTENRFSLVEPVGHGCVQVYNLEKGLQVRFWNVRFNYETELYNDTAYIDADAYFTLAFFLSTTGLRFSNRCEYISENLIWDTLFISNACDYKIQMSPKAKGYCLGISFSKKWLKNNVFIQDKNLDPLEEKINAIELLAIHESMNVATKKIVKELIDNTCKSSCGSFYIKSYVLKLLSDFFHRVKQKPICLSNRSIYSPISEIETYLQNNIHASLPKVQDLANQFSMSSSTLSRYFKKVHGMNISTYFIRKKMDFARQFLDEENRNLKEIASLLGYQNVTHFSTMLKKYM